MIHALDTAIRISPIENVIAAEINTTIMSRTLYTLSSSIGCLQKFAESQRDEITLKHDVLPAPQFNCSIKGFRDLYSQLNHPVCFFLFDLRHI